MPVISRAENRAQQTRAILDRAGSQLRDVGPAALSVRQIARDLEMASSAVYRYFPSRDALLTALIIEGYDDLADAVESADAAVRRRELLDVRWRAVCHAVRDWANAGPHRYALLYGSPVPGYAAPADTVQSAARIAAALLRIIGDAQSAGRHPVAPVEISPLELAAIEPVGDLVEQCLQPEYAFRGIVAYSTLFGAISLELFGHLHRGVLDYDAHFTQVVDQLAADLGLTN